MDRETKELLISKFVQAVSASCARVLDAKDAVHLGIDEKDLLNEFSNEFKEAIWNYNQIMAMNDPSPRISVTPYRAAREWATRP